jgi:hypothetical protein
VLVRALLHVAAGGAVTGARLQGFHLALWSGIPLGALGGGWAGRTFDVPSVLVGAGGVFAVAAAGALGIRPPRRKEAAGGGDASAQDAENRLTIP